MKKLITIATMAMSCAFVAVVCTASVGSSKAAQPVTMMDAGQDQRETRKVQVDVTEKIRLLGSADPIERATAACQLRALRAGASAAIPALLKMLGDDTPIARIECDGKDEWRRDGFDNSSPGKEAALTLAAIGDEAIGPLVNHLRDSQWQARRNSAFGLALIKNPDTVEPLIDSLKDEHFEVRQQSAWGLGLKNNDQRVVEPLIGALRDGEAKVRDQASWALGLVGDKRSVEPLTQMLNDASDKVRSQAAWALGLKGDDRAVEPLTVALRDQAAGVRSQAAWALGLKGDKRAVDALTQSLKDSDARVRSQSAWALGLKGDHRAIEALNSAAKDEDKGVRRQATWALGMILMRDPDSASKLDLKLDLKLNLDRDNDDEALEQEGSSDQAVVKTVIKDKRKTRQ
jgi:HEAT repeat protein